jgi:uncharacterized iron-regulated membrane protein
MRLLRSVHAWAGLLLALVVAAIALSGTALVFKADYLRATIPAAREAAPTDPASLGRVAARAEAMFEGEMTSLVFATRELGLHQAYLRDGGGAYLDAQGGLVDRWQAGGRLEVWLFDLHHELLGGETGHRVVGFAALATVLMAVTGLVVWWPAAGSFAGRAWPRSLSRRDLMAQHRDLGAMAAVPVLLATLSGAAMVFPVQAKAVLDALLPSTGAAAEAPPPRVASSAATPPADWAEVLASAAARFPGAELRIVSWDEGGGVLSVRLRQPAEWHPNGRTRVTLARASGLVLETHDALAKPLSARAYDALYPLHAARVGGRPYDLLLALTGLALAALALVGGGSFLWQRHQRAFRTRASSASPPAAGSPV